MSAFKAHYCFCMELILYRRTHLLQFEGRWGGAGWCLVVVQFHVCFFFTRGVCVCALHMGMCIEQMDGRVFCASCVQHAGSLTEMRCCSMPRPCLADIYARYAHMCNFPQPTTKASDCNTHAHDTQHRERPHAGPLLQHPTRTPHVRPF